MYRLIAIKFLLYNSAVRCMSVKYRLTFFCLIILSFVVFLTGCGKKQEPVWEKWVTKNNGTIKDCSGMSGYQAISCEQQSKKVTTTQECVQWKE